MSALLRSAGKTARWILGGAAALIVLWSTARVVTRAVRGAGSAERDGVVELTVMHWSGEGGQEEDAIVADALAQFEARNPDIRVRRINAGDAASFFTKLQTMLAAGDPPDVFYVGYWRLAAFVRMGLLRPIDDLIERDARAGDPEAVDLGDFYSVTVDAFRYDGEVMGRGALYGLPKDFTTIGFYYNKDLFRRAGVPEPSDDWTWDEYVDAARRIGALEGCTGSEFVTWPMMLRLYLRTEGVDVASEDFETLHLREPALVAALERLAAWRHGEDRTLTSGKSKVAEGASVFLTGRVGLAGPFGRWVVPSYRKITGFEWDFAPMPRGAVHTNAVTTVAWSISSRTEHPDEAWRLVRALCDEESQANLARLGLAIPTRHAVAESDAFIDPSLPPSRDRAFLDAIPRSTVIPWPPNPKFESLLESRLNQAVKTGDLSVEEAITAFERAWATEGTSPLARGEFPPMPWGRIALAIGAAFIAAGAWLAVRARRTRPGPLARAEERAGYLLASPLLIGLALFMAFPIGLSLLLSFTRWNGVSTLDEAQLVGLANYEQLLFHDGRFFTSLRVTAWYALLAVPLGQAFALCAALLMNAKVRGIGFFRGAWYLPSVLAGVGVAVLWRWVFDGDAGLLNAALAPILAPFGLTPPEWFGADAAIWGAPAFALMNLWMVGGAMMIYLAGLQGIPRDLYEAADLDGASGWERFTRVTLPMLSPVILFNGIMAIIASFQVFTQAFVMTGGEPGDLTRFYVLYIYNQAFEFYEMGYASAMAWLLLVVVLTLTAVVMRGSRRHVFYEVSQ
ncbi:MAG: extracellular solute-binding protein [Planctomycetota bacterium]|nr:MAG: extracellular solute-binding protein [Planctomycetota bacterium]